MIKEARYAKEGPYNVRDNQNNARLNIFDDGRAARPTLQPSRVASKRLNPIAKPMVRALTGGAVGNAMALNLANGAGEMPDSDFERY